MQTKDRRNTLNIYDDKTFGAFNDKKHANKVDFIILQKIEHRKFYRLSIFRVMI